MYAIVSLLDQQHYTLLQNLWQELEADCGLAGVTLTPLPHFSWHIAAEYDFKRLEAFLANTAAHTRPFIVRTAGLGLFTGDLPVIFVPVIKNTHLALFHTQIWEQVLPIALNASLHYEPQSWVPHITLAFGDVDPVKLGCAMQKLAFQLFNWEILVDHFALVFQTPGQVGRLQTRFDFGSLEPGGIPAGDLPSGGLPPGSLPPVPSENGPQLAA